MRSLRRRLKAYMLAALLCTTAAVWAVLLQYDRARPLSVVFLDVGQGDSILIEAPNGNQMLIDGGPDKSVLRRLGEFLPLGDHTIDIVLATHPDKDHLGGLSYVLERYGVSKVFYADVAHDTAAARAFDMARSLSGAEEYVSRRGMVIDLGGGAYVLIRYPEGKIASSDTNMASAVTQLFYEDTEVLLTGDAPQEVERRLVAQDGAALRSDVLKLGHHGSKTSSAGIFLDTVDPETAIVSAGLNNSYGHPHPQVMALLRDRGILVESTAEEGSVVLVSDGKRIWRP